MGLASGVLSRGLAAPGIPRAMQRAPMELCWCSSITSEHTQGAHRWPPAAPSQISQLAMVHRKEEHEGLTTAGAWAKGLFPQKCHRGFPGHQVGFEWRWKGIPGAQLCPALGRSELHDEPYVQPWLPPTMPGHVCEEGSQRERGPPPRQSLSLAPTLINHWKGPALPIKSVG